MHLDWIKMIDLIIYMSRRWRLERAYACRACRGLSVETSKEICSRNLCFFIVSTFLLVPNSDPLCFLFLSKLVIVSSSPYDPLLLSSSWPNFFCLRFFFCFVWLNPSAAASHSFVRSASDNLVHHTTTATHSNCNDNNTHSDQHHHCHRHPSIRRVHHSPPSDQ